METNLHDYLQGIADAIKEKTGDATINAQDFASKIASIEVGGGSEPTIELERKDVNFYDYDGTLLYAYTLEEAHALTELPPAPTHKGLIFQEWNWDYEDVIATNIRMDVGATYITDDGATRLYLEIYNERAKKMGLMLYSASSTNFIVDWGDGTIDSFKGSGYQPQSHEYAEFGKYVISIQADDLWVFSSAGAYYNALGQLVAPSMERSNALKKIEIGNFVEKVGNYCFQQLRIESISLPKGIKSIGNSAFASCRSLRYLVVPKGTTSIGQTTLAYISSLYSISLPKGINISAQYVTMTGVAYITLSYTMETLDNGILREMRNLQYVEVPKGVKSIGSYALYGLISCAYVDFSQHEAIPSLAASNAISNSNTDMKIIVPDALYDEWIVATNWTTHASKIVKDSEYTRPL
jgi:hypothetical protein